MHSWSNASVATSGTSQWWRGYEIVYNTQRGRAEDVKNKHTVAQPRIRTPEAVANALQIEQKGPISSTHGSCGPPNCNACAYVSLVSVCVGKGERGEAQG
ncbi:hypothetical protein, unlikely [Trypanosoma brucei gambiense DAL972]|uniref:Uncharacterized protein n=1 Tax=Trypanosoma brucei gambiense (strain MHOM/CI/86/DAL972) TaxID=679716 RepID=C9ZQD5_TRYB9|nr:hypothetical protein, unlikely [Trypanosoma brucei gambiense DAL972]CBH11615.1 hypothetical protein, unlikely [Trypanosoma brucei gambiense DAL972]|eukprot:XP_011773900.1 hypothetical protein, unlikely [Trypanosoma brucei gambiense DAL972]